VFEQLEELMRDLVRGKFRLGEGADSVEVEDAGLTSENLFFL
jgi:hypothetical protein